MGRRTVLVFAPGASPTYVPLGIASLVSYVRGKSPDVQLSACDLNIELWRELALRLPDGARLLDFMRGNGESFYDAGVYEGYRTIGSACSQRIMELAGLARVYLRTGQCPVALEPVLDGMVERVMASDPELVGLSVMYLDQAAFALALARRLAGNGRSRAVRPMVVLGGAAMSALDVDELLRATEGFVDGVVCGEGEASMELLTAGASPEAAGVKTSSGVDPVAVEPVSMDRMGPPDFSVFDLGLYANPEPVLPVVLSRDCAWKKCKFCAHNFSFSGFRRKTVERFVDELEILIARHGVRHFYFADQYVAAATLERLSELILHRGLDVSFHMMCRPTADYTPARLELAAEAGCCWISWGVETGSQRLLDLVGKGTRREEIEQVILDSHRAGIANLLMMIFGLPTSTDADLDETFDLLERVYPESRDIKASSFVLFEGTDLARSAEQLGMAVTGREVLLEVDGRKVHSTRLVFETRGADGMLMEPRGGFEVSRWQRRKRWLGDGTFWGSLACEHFLLYSAAEATEDGLRRIPRRPRRVA